MTAKSVLKTLADAALDDEVPLSVLEEAFGSSAVDAQVRKLDDQGFASEDCDFIMGLQWQSAAIINEKPPSVVTALQEWEGYVLAIENKVFTARLLDITAGAPVEQEVAEFDVSELSEGDYDLLTEGAVFRWVIGNQITRGGQKRRMSQIIFRRMPAWTQREIEEARHEASIATQAIQWE